MLDEKAWVVEGCSFSTFEMRFKMANIVIYFQFSPLICFLRLLKRIFRYRKEHGSLRFINLKLLQYTWNFDRKKRERKKQFLTILKSWPMLVTLLNRFFFRLHFELISI
jgi:hypothetical protein